MHSVKRGEVCNITRKCACKLIETHTDTPEVKEKHKKKYFYDLSDAVCVRVCKEREKDLCNDCLSSAEVSAVKFCVYTTARGGREMRKYHKKIFFI